MRSNPFVDLQRITELAPQLQPHTLKDAVKGWTRGGLPAQSIPEGSRSSEPPLPGFDRVVTKGRGGGSFATADLPRCERCGTPKTDPPTDCCAEVLELKREGAS